MPVSWYYAVDGEKVGPVDAAELRQLAVAGILQPDDMVWREGLPAWVPAEQVNGLLVGFPPINERTTTTTFWRRWSAYVPLFLAVLAATMVVGTVAIVALISGEKSVPLVQAPLEEAAEERPDFDQLFDPEEFGANNRPARDADVRQPKFPADGLREAEVKPAETEQKKIPSKTVDTPERPTKPGTEKERRKSPVNKDPSNGPAIANEKKADDHDERIPLKIREYLERAETIRLSRVASIQKSVNELKFEILNSPPQLKADKKQQLVIAEKNLANVMAFRTPTAPLPLPMDVGDIGFHEVLFVTTILSEDTVEARMHDRFAINEVADYGFLRKPNRPFQGDFDDAVERQYIFTGVDAARLSQLSPSIVSPYSEYAPERLWRCKSYFRVVSVTPDAELLMWFPKEQRERLRNCTVISPEKPPVDIQRYRELFYQDKK